MSHICYRLIYQQIVNKLQVDLASQRLKKNKNNLGQRSTVNTKDATNDLLSAQIKNIKQYDEYCHISYNIKSSFKGG